MATRDYDAEITHVSDQIAQLDASARETMELEVTLEADLVRLEKDLATPATALDKAAFKECNATIEATHVKLSTARRAMGAISTARGRLEVLRTQTINEKHMAQAQEHGRSAIEAAAAFDQDVLPRLKETVGQLIAFGNACAASAAQGGRRDRVYDSKTMLALTFAQILRDAGLDVRVGEGIRTSRSNTDGYQTLSDALAEFRAAVETPAR